MKYFIKYMLALTALGLLHPAAVAATALATPAATATQAVAGDLGAIDAEGIPLLARKSNCSACHAISKKMLGPTWMEVSKKYKGADSYEFAGKKYSLEEGLFMKVSKGGAGVWGKMPMPANSPMVKDEDIKALVRFVLAMSK